MYVKRKDCFVFALQDFLQTFCLLWTIFGRSFSGGLHKIFLLLHNELNRSVINTGFKQKKKSLSLGKKAKGSGWKGLKRNPRAATELLARKPISSNCRRKALYEYIYSGRGFFNRIKVKTVSCLICLTIESCAFY